MLARESLLKNQRMRRSQRRLTLPPMARRITELKMFTPDRLTSSIRHQLRNRRKL